MVENQNVKISPTDVILSYLPLPHLLEREMVYGALYGGSKVVYYSGDMLKIKEDIALVRPTIFVSVPRLFNRFYEAMTKKFSEVPFYLKPLVNHGLNVKLKNSTKNGGYTHRVYDPLVFNKTKAAFGGRIRAMVSGSAPLRPEVYKFLKVVVGIPFLEGYGQT